MIRAFTDRSQIVGALPNTVSRYFYGISIFWRSTSLKHQDAPCSRSTTISLSKTTNSSALLTGT
jgi:hypothetical protein